MIGFICGMLPAGRFQRIVAMVAFVPILRDPYGLIRLSPGWAQFRKNEVSLHGFGDQEATEKDEQAQVPEAYEGQPAQEKIAARPPWHTGS
jgi:hypothetical protein